MRRRRRRGGGGNMRKHELFRASSKTKIKAKTKSKMRHLIFNSDDEEKKMIVADKRKHE